VEEMLDVVGHVKLLAALGGIGGTHPESKWQSAKIQNNLLSSIKENSQ
jgi:hypothetical protein